VVDDQNHQDDRGDRRRRSVDALLADRQPPREGQVSTQRRHSPLLLRVGSFRTFDGKERSLVQPIRGIGSLSLRPLICQILQFRKITGAIYRRYDEVLRPSMEVASPADSRQQQVARSCHCRTAFGHAQLPSRGRSSTVRTVVRADTRHTNPTVAGSSPRLRSEMARCARSHLAAVAWV
jgi:hypothetical protein